MSADSFKFETASNISKDKNNVESNLQAIVDVLTDILEHCLTSSQFKKLESMFETPVSLSDILSNINAMANLIKDNMSKDPCSVHSLFNESSVTLKDEDYLNLEKMVQKYEAEIRSHIKIEQQLNIYTQGLEDELDKYKTYIGKLKSEKSALEEKLKNCSKTENQNYTNGAGRARNRSVDQVRWLELPTDQSPVTVV